jgi:hypothetical protein
MLDRTGLLREIEIPGNKTTGPAGELGSASQDLSSYVEGIASTNWTTLETLPGGASLLGALDQLRKNQVAAPQPRPVTPPPVISPLSSTADVRAKLKAVFGDNAAFDRLSDNEVSALEEGVEELRPLNFSVAGLGVTDARKLLREAASRTQIAEQARQAQIRREIAAGVSRLGFPSEFVDILADASDDDRAEFKALPAVGALEDLRLTNALDKIK